MKIILVLFIVQFLLSYLYCVKVRLDIYCYRYCEKIVHPTKTINLSGKYQNNFYHYIREFDVNPVGEVRIEKIYKNNNYSYIKGTITIDDYTFKIEKNVFWEKFNPNTIVRMTYKRDQEALQLKTNILKFTVEKDDIIKNYTECYTYNTNKYICDNGPYTFLHGVSRALNLNNLIYYKDNKNNKIETYKTISFTWSSLSGTLKA